ncbi:MAG: aminodeoxychorismate/anthranilate synthase component II [Planctomycetes bacterium]|nr:aminodeoxychorismate/anthranilate synthase component II [Planctomycetota bacterium]
MILLVDNYDSFTWNLVQAFIALGAEVRVARNDALSVDQALALRPAAVVLSPGPGRPSAAGIQPALLRSLPDELPLLGVCLGHQGLVEACGGVLERDPRPVHGQSSRVTHDGSALFAGVPSPFEAARYHSLRARRAGLPSVLRLTAWTDEGLVMAVEHERLPRFGLQFHPESILTPQGPRILANFLALASVPAVPGRGRVLGEERAA